jgi:hypothetical protein
MKMILGKMIFFFVFGCIPKNAPKNILQCYVKDRAEGVGGEACVFGKWFMEKNFVNHFPVNGNYFPFDHHFTAKQTPANLKIFSGKYFTAKQTEP